MAKVEDNAANFQLCLKEHCGKCPSYPEHSREALYCARGKSKSEIERIECLCPDCPIWTKYGLGRQYYCD